MFYTYVVDCWLRASCSRNQTMALSVQAPGTFLEFNQRKLVSLAEKQPAVRYLYALRIGEVDCSMEIAFDGEMATAMMYIIG